MQTLELSAFDKFKNAISNFWYWWSSQLTEMIPKRFTEQKYEYNRLDIILNKDSILIETVTNGEGRSFADDSSLENLSDSSWHELEEFCEDNSPRLFLNEDDFLIKEISLPKAAQNNLEEAVKFQIPQISPVKPEKIEWKYIKSSTQGNQINLKLFIAKIEKLNSYEMLFADKGMMPPIICVRDDQDIIIYRKPLQISSSLFSDRVKIAKLIAAFLILSIPFTTIIGAEILTRMNEGDIQIAESNAVPKMKIRNDAIAAEKLRRTAVPLLNRPVITPILDQIAQNLPNNSWLITFGMQSNREVSFVIESEAGLQADVIFEEINGLGNISIIDETVQSNGKVHYTLTGEVHQ